MNTKALKTDGKEASVVVLSLSLLSVKDVTCSKAIRVLSKSEIESLKEDQKEAIEKMMEME